MVLVRLLREFGVFLVERKLWWMTPILVILLLMAIFIVLAESSPVLPFVYTLF